jgi:trans-aconitate methyltransferase
LAELLGSALDLKSGQMVVDYGCGVGRLSKALIERYDCLVLGVDSSASMRSLATDYVGSGAFSVVSRRTFDALSRGGFKADAAVCVWVLQHCLQPAADIGLIRRALEDGCGLAVVNNLGRAGARRSSTTTTSAPFLLPRVNRQVRREPPPHPSAER